MLAQTELLHQLDCLPVSEQQGFVRLRTPIDVTSLIGWLKAQPIYPRIYWHARGRDREFAAIGCIKEITDPNELAELNGQQRPLAGSYPRYYGGLAFDYEEPVSKEWAAFGQCHFVLPRIELVRLGGQTELVCNLLFEDTDPGIEIATARNTIQSLMKEIPLFISQLSSPAYTHTPNQEQWQQWIQDIVAPEHLAETPKVVLSRRSALTFRDSVNPWDLLAKWQQVAPSCFHIGFQFSADSCFIANSPERLYRRENNQLFSEALAGSISGTGDPTIDAELAETLLHDTKNREENHLVEIDILDHLEGLVSEVTVSDPKILSLKYIQHIKREIQATLHKQITDWDILQRIHPTPAVGGRPREHAMQKIRELEFHQRGWYAGACGFISEDVSEFTVSIRSGLWYRQQLYLYVGAGILAGSDADTEWRELDTKLHSLLKAWHD